MSKSSPVWDYFLVDSNDSKKADCLKCKAKLSRGGKSVKTFNTTNLIGHLKSAHSYLYEELLHKQELLKKNQAIIKVRASSGQLKITVYRQSHQMGFHRHACSACNQSDRKMIALDDQAFMVVENVGFKHLMKVLEPRYQLPSRYYFSKTLIPEMYNSCKAKIQSLLSTAFVFSFTTDIWSNGVESFLSLTCHWINKNMERMNALLYCRPIGGSHTGENLSGEFGLMLGCWNLDIDQVHVLLRDNARNMEKAGRLSHIQGVPCFAHTMQLIIHDGVFSQRVVIDILALGRSIVGHFKHSILAKERLAVFQNELKIPVKKLVQDEITRWNSSYYMLKSLIEQKRALVLYATEHGIETFTAHQWGIIENLVDLLVPWEEATRDVSSSSATIANVIPLLVTLKAVLQQKVSGLHTMQEEMLTSLHKRFAKVELEKHYVLATALDPRFKLKFFSSPVVTERCKAWLLAECEVEKESGSCAEEQPPRKKPMEDTTSSKLWDVFDAIVSAESAASSTSCKEHQIVLIKLINSYFEEQLLERANDPMAWWGQNIKRFEPLRKSVYKYLSAPPSSVPSEQLFSRAGKISTDSRKNLKGAKLEMLLFLKYNLKVTEQC